MTELSAKGTRLNRRGLETRAALLDAAVKCLAERGPEGASANLVAKEAGVTWGTVQHQFGDADGLWAAVLGHVSFGDSLLPTPAPDRDVAARLQTVVPLMWRALEDPSYRAIHALRTALPRSREALERDHPKTASALEEWDRRWEVAVRRTFEGLPVDATRLHRVRSLLPGAVRGLHEERFLSSYADTDAARRGLVEALTAYLS